MTDETSAPAAIPESAPTPASVRRGVGVLELALVSTVAAAAAVAAYHFVVLPRQLPKLATVDLAALYREQEAAFTGVVSQDNVTDEARQIAIGRAEAFARVLPGALEELSQDCGCTVLSSNAVAGRHGVIDLTAELRRRIGL